MNEYAVLLVFDSPRLERFLLARHRDRGWELPGGRVEPGETPLAAARREWDEETGLPLVLLEPLAVHARPDGSRGHLFLGAASRAPGETPAPHPHSVDPMGGVVQVAWFRALKEVAPLAFPDDPYAELARLVLGRTHGGPWGLSGGEEPDGFIRRLAAHPAAHPRDDPVEPVRHSAGGGAPGGASGGR